MSIMEIPTVPDPPVRHGYGGIDAGAYEPAVRVRVGDRQRQGWIHVPRPHAGDH